jgi:RNA polymerase subunit RPABC4/transcription elongation factor Spt4
MQIAGPEALGPLLASRLGEEWDTGRSITVADLLATLLPYAHVRSALGLTMKGEYDLAILRLLLSEEHIRVDAELAEAVERELAAPEPGLDFLSELAEAEVEVRPEAWAQWSVGSTSDPGPGASTLESHAAETRSEGSLNGAPIVREWDQFEVAGEDTTDRLGQAAGEAWGEADRSATWRERCRHCQRVLPERGDLQFCPYCGVGQADPTCANCDEQLERGWAYCPRCGKAKET